MREHEPVAPPEDPTGTQESAPVAEELIVPCTMRHLLLYFLRLGAVGFGGPIALVGYMQRDLVDERRWVSKQDYLEGLALAQLAPGPLAAQRAIYLGGVRGGVLGATWVGLAFVIPSFLMVCGIAVVYIHYGGLKWMQGVFYGVGAAVIALIARSAVKLVRMTLGKDKLLWLLWGLSAAVTGWTESEIVWIFLGSGLVAMLIKAPPRRLAPTGAATALFAWPVLFTGMQGPATGGTLWRIFWYFTEAGAFVFGSGLAIVPFLYGGVVNQFHWLNERQFVDAVAVAMITPGPVVITVGFIGYLVAGPVGAVVAALGTFLPCYLFTVIPAPYYHRFAHNRSIKAFVGGVTAAATGAIAPVAFILGKRALVDSTTVLLFLGTLFIIVKFKKVPEPVVIVCAGLLGLVLKGGLAH